MRLTRAAKKVYISATRHRCRYWLRWKRMRGSIRTSNTTVENWPIRPIKFRFNLKRGIPSLFKWTSQSLSTPKLLSHWEGALSRSTFRWHRRNEFSIPSKVRIWPDWICNSKIHRNLSNRMLIVTNYHKSSIAKCRIKTKLSAKSSIWPSRTRVLKLENWRSKMSSWTAKDTFRWLRLKIKSTRASSTNSLKLIPNFRIAWTVKTPISKSPTEI